VIAVFKMFRLICNSRSLLNKLRANKIARFNFLNLNIYFKNIFILIFFSRKVAIAELKFLKRSFA